MKILLVDNFWYNRVGRQLHVEINPHLGLMSLASVLENAGHEAAILDPKILFRDGRFGRPGEAFHRAWADACQDSGADVIGFTAYGRTLPPVLKVAGELRRRCPELPIILGGPHATIVAPRLTEAFEYFTAVVRYEAEPIIVPLVESLGRGESLSHIPNLVYREGGKQVETRRDPVLVDMSELPYPALHLYPESELREIEMSLEAGRGCPFACTFCSTANFFQRRYRLKSNQRLVDEMERTRARYGVDVFNLNHDLFGLKRKSLREFCKLIKGRGISWKCSMRSDTLDLELLAEMKQAGCRDIYFGIESGSERLQKTIKKRLDLETTKTAISKVIADGLYCTVSFITGFPDESEDEQDATLDLIGHFLKLGAPRLRAQLHTLSPEPGSQLGDNIDGIMFDGIGPEADDILDHQLIMAHPDIFSVYYHFPTKLPRWRVVMSSFFVMSLIPQLGVPVVNHLVDTCFEGQLSRLFRSLFPKQPHMPLTDHNAILALLWSAMDRLVDELSGDAPWLIDMVCLSKLLLSINETRANESDPDADFDPAPVWLVRLSHPISMLGAKTGMLDPAAVPKNERGAPVPGQSRRHWYLIHAAEGSSINAHSVAEAQARLLVDETFSSERRARRAFETTPYVRVA